MKLRVFFRITVNVLKFRHFIPYHFGLNFGFYAVVSEILSGKANSVDPGLQEQSDLGLNCLHMPLCQTVWYLKF